MNILYFFPEYNTPMYQWQRIHFINELERHGIFIETFNPLKYNSWDEANEVFLNWCKDKRYDLCMTDICNKDMLFIDTILKIKKMAIPTLCFRPDNLSIPYNDKELSPYFDLVWLTSKETKYLYDKWNVNTFFAPYAANPYYFTYTQNNIIKHIAFIGTPYGSRSKMMNYLTAHSVNLQVYFGKNKCDSSGHENNNELKLDIIRRRFYLKLCLLRFKEGRKLLNGILQNKFTGTTELLKNDFLHLNPSVPFEQIPIIYSEAALALASTSTGHTDILSNPLKIINLRNFEIPMSGGIEICKYCEELSQYYEENKEIIFYKTDEELIDKAIYYTTKAKDSELQSIKQAARKKSENEHSWTIRFNTVFNRLGIKP